MSNGEDPKVFTVIGAKGLQSDATVGTFVIVSMGDQTLFRTKSVTGESPQWNESHPITISGSRSFSIAIHRENSEGDILLGDVNDVIVSSGPTELILPIEQLNGGRQILVTISIKRRKDIAISNDNHNPEHLVCLSNFCIKSLSDRHPDLPRSACLSVVIIVNGNTLYETTAVKKEPSDSHWNCNGKAMLSGGVAYEIQVINDTASKKRLGFAQLDREVLENPQEKRVKRKMAQYTKDDPWLEIAFTAKVLGLSISDKLPQAGGSISSTCSGLPLGNVLDSPGNSVALLSSKQPSSNHSSSTFNGSNRSDISSHQIAGLVALGALLLEDFESKQNLVALEKAISVFHDTMKIMPEGHQDSAFYYWKFGTAVHYRFGLLRKLPDIDLAVALLEKSVSLFADGHPAKTSCIVELGNAFQDRFESLGDISDLQKAIHKKEKAVELTPTGQPNKAMYLSDLSNSYQIQFDQLGEISVLEKAISTKKNAVELTPTDHPNKVPYLNNLGNSYHSQFERLGDISVLEKAISAFENVVWLTPTSHPNKAMYLNNLGVSYQLQYKRLGEISVLEKAIAAQEHAVELTPTGDQNKALYLNSLGISYQSQFEMLGEISVLEKAISALENAVQLTPTGHPNKASYFSNLGTSYQSQVERLGEISVLEKAIAAQENAVQLTSTGHPDRAMYLNNLGISYQFQFKQLGLLGEISILEKAISAQENAVELIPVNHPNKALFLNNLGLSYQSQFERLGEISILEKAISALENVVQLTPTSHPNKALYLNNLGLSYQSQFEKLGDISVLEKTISVMEDAVQLTPTGHPHKARYLTHLGISYQQQFERLGETSDLQKAIHCFSQASQSSTSPPGVCYGAAVFWAKCCEVAGLSPIEAYDQALHLLPCFVWVGHAILYRYTLLSQISNVVHDAADAAISSGKCEKAIEWLEQGRSIVWGQLLHLRTPVDDLQLREPALASQLLSVSQALDKASAREIDPEAGISAEKIALTHNILASEWDKLIQQVRLASGFEGFLQPKTVSQLLPAANLGPIVIIAISGRGLNALILTSTSNAVQHISLDGFSETEATEALNRLRSFQHAQRARSGPSKRPRITGGNPETWFCEMLSRLWTKIVKPILEYLAIPVAQTSPPRIWWCPTGPLAFLPIHAAGDYTSDAPGSKIFDYVVSSYTPTVTALLDNPRSIQHSKFKLLAVSQASTSLPNADIELDQIKQYIHPFPVECLRGQEATVERVIQGMSEASWVHLVCHGSQDAADPTKSALHLADEGRLELSQINKMGLPHAEFAYLSACQTATGDVDVKEEAVHLAAGMLMAGYRGVIATMWAIRDEDGPPIANDVYAELLKDGQPDHTRAAYALHLATQNLRRGGASFLSWVPFIHIGR